MKKVILNQISKAVAGGSNYFYLPLHLSDDKASDSHYETTADLSKLFELDSNGVPVVKEINVYDEDNNENVYLSYSGDNKDVHEYYTNNSKSDHMLSHDGNGVWFDGIEVVKKNTDETDDSSPKDGGK